MYAVKTPYTRVMALPDYDYVCIRLETVPRMVTSTQDIQQQQAASRSPGSEHTHGKDAGTQTKTTITCRRKLGATVNFVGMTPTTSV